MLGLWRRGTEAAGLTEALLDDLVKLREEARGRKDYATSDRIRDLLASHGIVLEDTKSGVRWKRR